MLERYNDRSGLGREFKQEGNRYFEQGWAHQSRLFEGMEFQKPLQNSTLSYASFR